MKPKEFNAGVELLGMMALKKMVEGIDLDRLEEICKAEKEGRCQVLPCLMDKPIWVIEKGKIIEGVLIQIMYRYNQQYPKMIIKAGASILQSGVRIDRYANQIGKTVFLTRFEAEAALERR